MKHTCALFPVAGLSTAFACSTSTGPVTSEASRQCDSGVA